MFVILIYDISIENSNKVKVLNICRQYLFHIQDSCFHGYISHKNINELKRKLIKVTNEDDHIVIYTFSTDKYMNVEELGKSKLIYDTIIE